MNSDLNSYHEATMQEILARAGASADFHEVVFSEWYCDFLVEQAVIEDYTVLGYRKTSKGLKADAWHLEPDGGTLSLFVTDFRAGKSLESLTGSEITRGFKRAEKFLSSALDPKFYRSLEESSPEYAAAREICEARPMLSRVNLYLLSNAEISRSATAPAPCRMGELTVHHEIWDISRPFRIESSGKAREDIVIDFSDGEHGGVPCLRAFTGGGGCESYLLAMPGKRLAELYALYGERLLEQNVRTFLQFRGKVNQGIRNTIRNEPGMFFAYNNGITATAEAVTLAAGGTALASVTNLQIVNGGQTTASLFTAGRQDRADLGGVYVQVKLTVIPSSEVERVVPRISEYANTQNKVSAADFFSNHPFHLRIEDFSRRLWAPSPEGGLRETLWFYERARGQFANAQANLTPARKKEFLAKNPNKQKFTKTDLAKYETSFAQEPWVVSRGAQKNFAAFASDLSRRWDRNPESFNEIYFERLIAKAIIFRYLDSIILKQPWYEGGYKANVVTYSLAKLVNMVEACKRCLDLDGVWSRQRPGEALETQLEIISKVVNLVIQQTPPTVRNVTEYCKRESCWEAVRKADVELLPGMKAHMVDPDEVRSRERDAAAVQEIDDDIHAQTYVLERGAPYWCALQSWDQTNRVLSPKERGILGVACSIPGKLPTERQCKSLLQIERRAIAAGFFLR